jgi:hypothetical protein
LVSADEAAVSRNVKRVVSVSLGSSQRDHEATVILRGTRVEVLRRGVDGDLERARALMAELDGHVDALGLGGIDLALTVDDRQYPLPDAQRLKQAVQRTPVVDGYGLKAVWEPAVVARLVNDGVIRAGDAVLMTSAMDRYPMAAALVNAGCEVVFGDLMFSSRIDYPIRSLAELKELAAKILPELTKLPFTLLYPTGSDQEAPPDPRFARYFAEARILAGDFHYLRRYLPDRLQGQIVVTTTTTPADVELLRTRGASLLVTTTPRLAGRTFGTNAMEAALVAAGGITADDPGWSDLVMTSGLEPDMMRLGVETVG